MDDSKLIRADFKDIFNAVQSYGESRSALTHTSVSSVGIAGAASFTGKDKAVWEAKQIAALGGRLQRKEKMPYKMYQGVMKARKVRAAKAEEEARMSGVVTGKGGKRKEWRGGQRPDRDAIDRHGNPGDLLPDNVRGPVMYLNNIK